VASIYQVRASNISYSLIRAIHLDKCCEYWYYNYANKDNPNPEEFKFPVEMALELLIAADFLDCSFTWYF
jgi:elongin-C